jgi:hypothetical protein
MTNRLIVFITLLMLGGMEVTTQGQVSFKESPTKIEVDIGGKPFTTFYYGGDFAKPFLHPLRTATGVIVTRGYPLEKIEGESNDHFWHRGLWFAHGDINGIDFWREASGDKATDAKLPLPVGRIVAKSAPKVISGKDEGTITADFDLVAPDKKVIGSLREKFTIRRSGTNNVIDVEATVLADRGTPLKMGDTEEGLLGFRFADEFRQDRGATLSNSDGLKGTDKIWGKRAKWVDYSTNLKGEKAGVVIFDHPQNPKHPTYWHARGYGLNSANPFGEHDFLDDKSRDGSLTIAANGTLNFRYRVVIHPGGVESIGVDQLYAAYAKEK